MWFSLKWWRVKGRVEAESLFDDSLEGREYQLHVLAARDRAEDAGGSSDTSRGGSAKAEGH